MLFIVKHKIQEVANTRRITNKGTKNQKAPTSSKVRPFLLVCIAKRKIILKENVGGGQMSSVEIVAIWEMHSEYESLNRRNKKMSNSLLQHALLQVVVPVIHG